MLSSESTVNQTREQFYFNYWQGFIFHQNQHTKDEERILCSRKMHVLTQVDANKEIHIALIARVGTVLSTLGNSVKKRKDTEKCNTQCSQFSGQRNSHKQSPFQELESLLDVWFQQARGSNAHVHITERRSSIHCHKVWH